VPQISGEPLNGFTPNSHGRRVNLEEFECQGQRSKVKVTRDKKTGFGAPITPAATVWSPLLHEARYNTACVRGLCLVKHLCSSFFFIRYWLIIPVNKDLYICFTDEKLFSDHTERPMQRRKTSHEMPWHTMINCQSVADGVSRRVKIGLHQFDICRWCSRGR